MKNVCEELCSGVIRVLRGGYYEAMRAFFFLDDKTPANAQVIHIHSLQFGAHNRQTRLCEWPTRSYRLL
jgi:hypothetical protein